MRKFTLDNGVRVFFDQDDGPDLAIAAIFSEGSRHDPVKLTGLHHALEHLMSRSTEKFQSWEEICGHADDFFTAFNAETTKSSVSFFVECQRGYARTGVVALDQMINHPLFLSDDPRAAKHLADEQGRMANERREANDLTVDWVDERFDRIMLTGGLAHTVDGPVPVIKRYTLIRLKRLYHHMVVGRRLTIVVSGGFNEPAIEASIRKAFCRLPIGRKPVTPRALARRGRMRISLKDVPGQEQIHFPSVFPPLVIMIRTGSLCMCCEITSASAVPRESRSILIASVTAIPRTTS